MNLKNMIAQAISKNLATKEETLGAILDNTDTKKRKGSRLKLPSMRWVRKPVAIAAAAALVLSASIFTIAVNLNKTATIELTAVNQYSSTTVDPGDTVTLTVGTANQTDFRSGIVGLTMDITYDSGRLTYTNETITSLLGVDFSVSANEAEAGTVTVLVYADDGVLPLSAAANGDLFSLDFAVKPDAEAGTCTFTPVDYKLADYTDDDTGFELINVTPVPEAVTVTVGEPLTIDTSVTDNVGGTVTGGGQAFIGNDKTITITPDAGWYISSVLVDDAAIDLNTMDSPGLTLNMANGYTFSNVQADCSIEVTFKQIFYMVPGASIRLVDNAALRFVTEVSAEFLDDLDDKDVTYNLGTLILPENLISAGTELTRTTLKVKDIPQVLWQDSSFFHAEGYKVMTGVITDIPLSNYSRVLAGRAYITFSDDTIYTAATNVRSLKQVANMALNDPARQPPGNFYSQAQIAKLTEYSAE